MGLHPSVKILQGATSISTDTTINWTTNNPIILKGMMTLDENLGIIKIGDGILHYNDLPIKIHEVFTPEFKTILTNLLDGNGKINLSLLPDNFLNGNIVRFVADITARDALTENDRSGLIFVLDASADPTVTLGSAQYVWNTDHYEKIGEKESIDLDLTNYFNMTTKTLDDIADGTNYVKMTTVERSTLLSLNANSVKYTDKLWIQGVDAATLNTYFE